MGKKAIPKDKNLASWCQTQFLTLKRFRTFKIQTFSTEEKEKY